MRKGAIWQLMIGIVVLAIPIDIFSQEIRPNAEFRLGAQYFIGDKLRLSESDGPHADILGNRGAGHGIFGEARWSHGRNRDRAVGLRVDLERTPFGHAWITRVGEVWGQPIRSDGERQSFIELIPSARVYVTYAYVLVRSGKLTLQANVAIGGALLPGKVHFDYPFDRLSIYDEDHPNYNSVIYSLTAESRSGMIPVYRAGISLARDIFRQNRLHVDLFYSGSFTMDAFRVNYTMYPGTTAESTGYLRQSLDQIGLSLSYGISHGAPKMPRHYDKRYAWDDPPSTEEQQPDTTAPKWTRNAITLSYGHFWHQPFRLSPHEGDFHTYGHRGQALALHYEHRLERGILFGGEVQYGISRFLMRMTIDHPLYVAVNGTTGTRETGQWNHPNLEFMLFAGHELKSNDRWRLDALFLAGVAPGVGVSSGSGYKVRVDTTSFPIFSIRKRIDGKINPMVGIRLNGVYRLGNHDRLVLSLEARTTLTDYYTGHFAIYPDPADIWEAQGKLRGKLAYAGVRLGYAVAWGAPRQPRWMRLKERYEREPKE